MIDPLIRLWAQNYLQWLPTIMARIIDRDFDQACIAYAKRYGVDECAEPLFKGP